MARTDDTLAGRAKRGGGLTSEALAAVLGVSSRTVARWLAGSSSPGGFAYTLLRIADGDMEAALAAAVDRARAEHPDGRGRNKPPGGG